jgi:threonine/homoserine/homoserine lactone efflux protein
MLAAMGDALTAVVAGGSVGFAVAVPLGPVGLAVVAAGQRGWWAGFAAAAGVATADLLWATVAASGGAAVAGHPAVEAGRVVARLALIALGIALIVGGLRRLRSQPPAASDRDAAPAPPARSLSPIRRYLMMVAVTLPNPLTVAVFSAAAVDTGLVSGSAVAAAPPALLVAMFAIAVGLASLSWQLLLAGTGRGLAIRATPAVSAWLTIATGAFLLVWPLIN